VPIVLKSWSLNLLEPSGPVQGCNGIALRLPSARACIAWNWEQFAEHSFLKVTPSSPVEMRERVGGSYCFLLPRWLTTRLHDVTSHKAKVFRAVPSGARIPLKPEPISRWTDRLCFSLCAHLLIASIIYLKPPKLRSLRILKWDGEFQNEGWMDGDLGGRIACFSLLTLYSSQATERLKSRWAGATWVV
jgi:hypothetical protein